MTSKTTAKSKFIPKSRSVGMVKGSIEKMQRPLNIIREKSLEEAMKFLLFSNYGASKEIAKLLKSAAANAVNTESVSDIKALWVSKIWAVKSLELRRMKAGPRGRGRPIRRRYSRIFVELGVKED